MYVYDCYVISYANVSIITFKTILYDFFYLKITYFMPKLETSKNLAYYPYITHLLGK